MLVRRVFVASQLPSLAVVWKRYFRAHFKAASDKKTASIAIDAATYLPHECLWQSGHHSNFPAHRVVPVAAKIVT